MSGQDVGFFNVGTNCPDLVIENGDLKADNGLETSALISLFSDKRVTFEELPSGLTDRRGWWADLTNEIVGDQIGSRIWTLALVKVVNATSVELESMLTEAFQWMLDDGIATQVVVSAARAGQNQIDGEAKIIKPDGDDIPFKFIWDGQELKLLE